MKNGRFTFAVGMLTGAVLFSGVTAYAAGVIAEYAPQRAYVDGTPVQLEAYSIDGNNYVKLRDIGEMVGFNVYWDGKNIQIDSAAPYTGLSPAQSSPAPSGTQSYSQEAASAAFTGELTREVYDAIRDTVLHRNEIATGAYAPATVDDTGERYNLMQDIVCRLGNYPAYNVTSPEVGKLAVTAQCTSYYDEAVAHTQPFLDSISGLGQREKVRELVWYICDRMEYSSTIATPNKILASDGVTSGNCMSYAHSLLFLCNRADVPCLLVNSSVHQWNMVYVDGQWWDVDVGSTDCAPPDRRENCRVFTPISERFGSDLTDSDPNLTRFAQELLVPGSTK